MLSALSTNIHLGKTGSSSASLDVGSVTEKFEERSVRLSVSKVTTWKSRYPPKMNSHEQLSPTEKAVGARREKQRRFRRQFTAACPSLAIRPRLGNFPPLKHSIEAKPRMSTPLPGPDTTQLTPSSQQADPEPAGGNNVAPQL